MAGAFMVQGEQAVSAEAARSELDRILGSPHLDASERNRRFLTFERYLADGRPA